MSVGVPDDLFVLDEEAAYDEVKEVAARVVAGNDPVGYLRSILDRTGSPTYAYYVADQAACITHRLAEDSPPPLIGRTIARLREKFVGDALIVLTEAVRRGREPGL